MYERFLNCLVVIKISCYYPTYIRRNLNKVTGEVSHKYLGRYTDGYHDARLALDYGGEKVSNNTDFFDHNYENNIYKSRFIQIPCGRCIGCRMDYARSWADRLTYHVMTQPKDVNWFITLTYDDEYLHTLKCENDLGLYSLNYEHKDEFMKKLRNKFRGFSIDFYLSGEYGGQFHRPHFHAIIFNCPIDDLVFWKVNDNGDPIYLSDLLTDLWSFGFTTITPFSWVCSAYVAKYVEKKSFGYDASEYKAFGLEPEKSFCSRRPGIAYDYYVSNYADIWKNNGMNVSRDIVSNGHLGIPRYFRKLALEKGIGREEFLESEQNTLQKQNFDRSFKIDNSSFDLSRVTNMLKFEEENVINRMSSRKF